MNIEEYLERAGVPPTLWPQAVANIGVAKTSAKGLLLHKLKVRLFKAGAIARLLPFDAERLCDVKPLWKTYDVAPMINITAHGDNVPWKLTANGVRPVPGAWLEDSPEARAANYWCPGEYPRSVKSRKAWYRRNGGEYLAWLRGFPVNPDELVKVWRGNGVTVRLNNGAWQIVAQDKWLGFIPVKVRIGFEIDNVLAEDGVQLWFPIEGHALRAPVTWSVLPGKA